MAVLVTPDRRPDFHDAIEEMHRHRKVVFVDGLGWPLPIENGSERDAFDADATYLLNMENGRVTASLRLLATDRPHLLSEHFGHLCEGEVPRSPDIYEVTRLCVAPDLATGVRRTREIGRIMSACMEYALFAGAEALTFVQGMTMVPFMLRVGWDIRPLGLPEASEGDSICAWRLGVSAEALRCVASFYRVALPQLRVPAPRSAAA